MTSRLVAVGNSDNNHIAYSDNSGGTWTGLGLLFGNGTADRSYGIAYNSVQDKYVAVGRGDNWAMTSTNGIDWVDMVANKFSQGRGIATNGNRWVAVGTHANKSIVRSDNGITWTNINNSKDIFSDKGNFVAVNGNNWVAGGKGSNHMIGYSTDNAVTWTHSLMVNGSNTSVLFSTSSAARAAGHLGQVRTIATNGTRWIVGGKSNTPLGYSDNNGQTWNVVNDSVIDSFKSPNEILGSHWDGEKFWVGGTGGTRLAYSSNGINWTAATNPLGTNATSFVSYNNVIILGGQNAGQYTSVISLDKGSSWNGLIHRDDIFTDISTTTNIINGFAYYYIPPPPPPVPYFATGITMPTKIGVTDSQASFHLGRMAILKKIDESHKSSNMGKNVNYNSVQGLQSSNVFAKPINSNSNGLRTQRLRLTASGIGSIKVTTENEKIILGNADNNLVNSARSRVRGSGGGGPKR